MSITAANTAGNMVMVTAVVGVAQRLAQGEWGWTWIAYLWGGIVAFTIIGCAIAGIFALIGYLTGGKERERQARLVRYDGYHLHIVDPRRRPPGVGRLVIVPGLGLIQVDPLPAAIRQTVNEAVERLRRDVAPDAWIEKLPEALSPLRERGYEVRKPTDVWHWHDPGPQSISAPPGS